MKSESEVFTERRAELAAQGFTGYRFCIRSAHDAGETRHAALAIREWFPDATSAEVMSVADCVLFNTRAPLDDPPSYFIKLEGPWVHSEDVWRRYKGQSEP